jgi:hypothetical protein
MKKFVTNCLLSLLSSFVFFTDAHSQNMKPGLWEYQSTSKSKSGEMENAMAEMRKGLESMPAEERKKMMDMMAQSGMQFDPAKGNTQIMRICITPQEANNMDFFSDPECKQDIIQRNASNLKIRFKCGGDMPSQGEGTFTFKGDTVFSGQFWFEIQDGGKKDRIEMTQNGKWVSSSCGNLKPRR